MICTLLLLLLAAVHINANQDCSTVRCDLACPNPLPPKPGECCGQCLEDCRVIFCANPPCSNPTIPQGRCCPICSNEPGSTGCPPESPPVFCLINPCTVTKCPNFPRARCVFDNCGGCNARFFIGRREVTDQCNTGTPTDICELPRDSGPCRALIPRWFFDTRSGKCQRFTFGGCQGNANNFETLEECINACVTRCPPGVPVAACLVDPCSVSTCAAVPGAICAGNFCGKCSARWFDGEGNEVTSRCDTGQCSIQGQVFTECRSACPPTCSQPNPICTLQCLEPGCQCPPGTLLNERRQRCVSSVSQCRRRQCSIQGQVFTRCGSACPPTCSQPNPICTRQCVPGCQCPPGTLLDERRQRCVSGASQCGTRQCSIQGQVFTQCGSACPPTCSQPNPICTRQCVPGCQCPPGTLLDERQQRCVSGVSQCRRRRCSIQGQVFTQCGSACPPTCKQPVNICSRQCVPGCQCPPSTLLDERRQRCVSSASQCSTSLRQCTIQGQVFTQCGSACPPTCSQPNPICTRQCVPGCQCPPGTLLNERRQRCVSSVSECVRGTRRCSIQGQVFTRCGSACPPTCDKPGPSICNRACIPGCQCPQGTILDERRQRCVNSISQCSGSSSGKCPIEGQVIQNCRTCPATCNDPDLRCTLECRRGCGCPPGQLIDEINNKCVPRRQCPSNRCPIPNQVFFQPPSCRPCLVTCKDVGQLIPCPAICASGCACPQGMVLDEVNNRCVQPSQCPQRDCSRIQCPPVRCQNNVRPILRIGECCPRCPGSGGQGEPGSCAGIFCDIPNCGVGVVPITRPGDCCPSCPHPSEPDCSAVSCPVLPCSNPITPPGRCCAICPPGPPHPPRPQRPPHPGTGICKLPKDPGPCYAAIRRYFYNRQTKQCELFIYGGCAGNENNFETLAECESRCNKPSICPPVCSKRLCSANPHSLCTLPPDTPPKIPGCSRGPCDVTSCKACYYSDSVLPLPSLYSPHDCPKACSPGDDTCLSKWGFCVNVSYLYASKRGRQSDGSGQFRCWRPPCPLIG